MARFSFWDVEDIDRGGECGEAASSAIGLEVDEGMATRPTGERVRDREMGDSF